MDSLLLLDEKRYRLFMKENAGWQTTIKAQVNEIPVLLASTGNMVNETGSKERDTILYGQLVKQQHEMEQLEDDIALQQKKMHTDGIIHDQYDIDVFWNQDILRERIRTIEKAFIDLKCNFLNYVTKASY